MRLAFERYGSEDPDHLWHARPDVPGVSSALGATPLDALAGLARQLAKMLGEDEPELMADPRLDPFGGSMHFPWATSTGSFETSGPDPAHAMYLLCERLEAALGQ